MKHTLLCSPSYDFETLPLQALVTCTGGDGTNDAQRGYTPATQLHPPLGVHLGQTAGSTPVKCGAKKASFAETGASGLSVGGLPIAAPIAVCPRVPQFERNH